MAAAGVRIEPNVTPTDDIATATLKARRRAPPRLAPPPRAARGHQRRSSRWLPRLPPSPPPSAVSRPAPPAPPRPADPLQMLHADTGEPFSDLQARTVNAAFVLYAEHDLAARRAPRTCIFVSFSIPPDIISPGDPRIPPCRRDRPARRYRRS